MAFHAINHIHDADDAPDLRFQWYRNSIFPFYQFNLLGVASKVQTGVDKQWITVTSPKGSVFNVFHTINDQPGPRLAD